MRLKTRGIGVLMFAFGAVILLAVGVAPVPVFGDLERRVGLLEDAREERISPCRSAYPDCLHAVVDVRHPGGMRSYNFAQIPVEDLRIGEDVILWVAPAIRGLAAERVWQVEQKGRVVMDYQSQARADRRVMWILIPFAPLLLVGGGWLVARYDWSGDPVPY